METLADDLKLKVSRGYSDHEHLDRAGFVHMNGRVYDPRTGRFLSPDPVVRNPAFSQSWHSYSYVANSPLSLVDPTGLFAQCPIPTIGYSCDPTASPGGGFVGAIETIISNIHRVRFEVFVYDVLVFGSTGNAPGDREYVFDVPSVIRILVSAESETVEREAAVDDKNDAAEPLDAQGAEQGWFSRFFRGLFNDQYQYEKMRARCAAAHGPEGCNEDAWRDLMPAFEALPETWGAGTVGRVAGKLAGAGRLSGAGMTRAARPTPQLGDYTEHYRHSVGAMQRIPRVLQGGGRTVTPQTGRALNEQLGRNPHHREWGRALEGLERQHSLPNNYHGRILDNGDYIDEAGNVVDNLLDFIPWSKFCNGHQG